MTDINEKPVVGQKVHIVTSRTVYEKASMERRTVEEMFEGTVEKVGSKYVWVRWSDSAGWAASRDFHWRLGHAHDPYGNDKTRFFTVEGYARQTRLDAAFAELKALKVQVTKGGYSRPDLSVDAWEAIVAAIKADRND